MRVDDDDFADAADDTSIYAPSDDDGDAVEDQLAQLSLRLEICRREIVALWGVLQHSKAAASAAGDPMVVHQQAFNIAFPSMPCPRRSPFKCLIFLENPPHRSS